MILHLTLFTDVLITTFQSGMGVPISYLFRQTLLPRTHSQRKITFAALSRQLKFCLPQTTMFVLPRPTQ